jgi:hypothetical protein
VCPCNVYDIWWNWRLPGTLLTVHFSGWKHICHFLSHSSSDDRSLCRSTASWIFLISNAMCRGLHFSQWFWGKSWGCWYWWNCWPSWLKDFFS